MTGWWIMKAREVIALLTKNGWKLTRVTGSHYQYKKPGVPFLATVPNHVGKDISVGVLTSLRKGKGIKEII